MGGVVAAVSATSLDVRVAGIFAGVHSSWNRLVYLGVFVV